MVRLSHILTISPLYTEYYTSELVERWCSFQLLSLAFPFMHQVILSRRRYFSLSAKRLQDKTAKAPSSINREFKFSVLSLALSFNSWILFGLMMLNDAVLNLGPRNTAELSLLLSIVRANGNCIRHVTITYVVGMRDAVPWNYCNMGRISSSDTVEYPWTALWIPLEHL